MNAELQAEVLPGRSAAIIEVSGELDLTVAPRLNYEFSALDPGIQLIIVDLRSTEFLDSTALSVIVSTHERLAEQNRALVLVRGAMQVQQLLFVTGIDKRIRLVDAPEDLLGDL